MKPIKIAVLMDDIKDIKPHKDSSLAMMLEASRRNWEIYTFDAHDLFAQDGQVLATCAKTVVFDDTEHWYEQAPKEDLPLDSFNVILMRKDPPFDMNYIYATYFLEQAENNGVLVVNKAQSLRDANEKLFALNFPHCIAKTLVSSNKNRLKEFIKIQGVSVVKPLDGMGGKDIFKQCLITSPTKAAHQLWHKNFCLK